MSEEADVPECCKLNEDGYSLAHLHVGTGIFQPCRPVRCPGCTGCLRPDED